MSDDKIAALERLAQAQNDALHVLIDHVRAVALVNAALIGTLDDDGRAIVRETALAALGEGPEHDRAAALIEAFTRDPGTVPAAQVAAGVALDGQGRLQ